MLAHVLIDYLDRDSEDLREAIKYLAIAELTGYILALETKT